MENSKTAMWILRVAIAGEFIGHGMFALQQKEGWGKYFTAVGISAENAISLMPLVGAADLLLAAIVLFYPIRAVILWMAIWGMWTAMIRWPVGPDPIWDFVERWANWGAPLALLVLAGWPKTLKEWLNK